MARAQRVGRGAGAVAVEEGREQVEQASRMQPKAWVLCISQWERQQTDYSTIKKPTAACNNMEESQSNYSDCKKQDKQRGHRV